MNKQEHKKIHEELHTALDMLITDFLYHTRKLLGETSILEFMDWSHRQTVSPQTKKGE